MKPEQTELSRLRREVITLKAKRDFLKNGPHGLPCPLCMNHQAVQYSTRGQWPLASLR